MIGLLQLVHAWVMLGPSWLPCPAAVAAIDATIMEDATSPGMSVYGMSGMQLWNVPMPVRQYLAA